MYPKRPLWSPRGKSLCFPRPETASPPVSGDLFLIRPAHRSANRRLGLRNLANSRNYLNRSRSADTRPSVCDFYKTGESPRSRIGKSCCREKRENLCVTNCRRNHPGSRSRHRDRSSHQAGRLSPVRTIHSPSGSGAKCCHEPASIDRSYRPVGRGFAHLAVQQWLGLLPEWRPRPDSDNPSGPSASWPNMTMRQITLSSHSSFA
jgi:hypothetical protein